MIPVRQEHTALRMQVDAIEAQMLALPQVELEHEDYFADHVYGRALRIPAGTVLTGRIHKFTNMNILAQGEMSVSTEHGVVRMSAPQVVVSPPGTKRIAYAHTDCVWVTVHGTDEVDVAKIEEHFTAANEQEYLAHCASLTIEGK
jgi:hypothetical protein